MFQRAMLTTVCGIVSIFGLHLAVVSSWAQLAFLPPETLELGVGEVRRAAVVNINADAFPDIVITRGGGPSFDAVLILTGDGMGGFSVHSTLNAGQSPYGVTVADLNGNGHSDLIVTQGTSMPSGNDPRCGFFIGTSVFLSNGSGGFTHSQCLVAGSFPVASCVGDFNGDGMKDIAIASRNSHGVSVFLAIAPGVFGSAIHVPNVSSLRATDLRAGQFNAPGPLDLVLAHDEGLTVILGVGNGSFFPVETFVTSSPVTAIDVADLDGNNNHDVVFSERDSGIIRVARATGSGGLHPPVAYPVGSRSDHVLLADINSDGLLDLVATDSSTGMLAILLNQGLGVFGGVQDVAAGALPIHLVAADWNQDGMLDLGALREPSPEPSKLSVLLQAVPGGGGPCEGDADQSGTVDVDDLTFIILRLGLIAPNDGGADVDGSGEVDIDDITYTVLRFGSCN